MSHENVELCDAESAERISDVFCSESNMSHLRRGISQLNAGKGAKDITNNDLLKTQQVFICAE